MKPTNPASRTLRAAKVPSQKAIVRAVASSSAIETGKSVRQIESLLLCKDAKRRKVSLAS